MAHLIVIKMKTIKIIFFFLPMVIFSQELSKETVTLYKGGKKHHKLNVYILINSDAEILNENIDDGVWYLIKGQRFFYSPKRHLIDTCLLNSKFKYTKIENLKKIEYQYYLGLVESEGLDLNYFKPMPISKLHQFLKIYLIKPLTKDKVIKYEVDWWMY